MSTRNPTPASFIGLLVCGLILVIAGLWMEATTRWLQEMLVAGEQEPCLAT